MDKRTLRSKKSKPRNARPYDRQNQSILGKVASKVKGLFNPSWLFNVSQWIGAPGDETEEPGCSTDCVDEDEQDDDFVAQSSIRSKRPRLTLHDHAPSILSASTQTWLEPPSQNLYNTDSNIPAAVCQAPLIGNKDSSIAMNGDDHSENSEGSASTSGCSSLVSSRKDRSSCLPSSDIRLGDHIFGNYERELKSPIGLKSKKDVGSQKGGLYADLNSSQMSLWSSPYRASNQLQRRAPSVGNSSQPSFNLSSFVGPSKFTEQKVASPFYEGKTTYGGASSIRRMPVTVAPYQVDKSNIQASKLKNQVKVREHYSDDGLEGMSSAAKRILMTLEKMSSPVTDAKKIPNTDTSPVDLSLYLAPPKHRRNAVFTPPVPTRGPPIANISTITKLTSLRNYDFKMNKKMNSSSSEIPDISMEQKSTLDNSNVQHTLSDISPLKSGGGKMRTKLNQQHQSSKEAELPPLSALPNVPLPISKLPTFSFASKSSQNLNDTNQNGRGFTFSNPIEVLPSVSAAVSLPSATASIYDEKPLKSLDQDSEAFVFSNPIEHILPTSSVAAKESVFSPKSSHASGITPATWECDACWVRNSAKESKCLACEAVRPGHENITGSKSSAEFSFNSPLNTTSNFGKSLTSSTDISASGFKFGSASDNASGLFFSSVKNNAAKDFKTSVTPNLITSSHSASFGGVKLDSVKSVDDQSQMKIIIQSETPRSNDVKNFAGNDSLSKPALLGNSLSTNNKLDGTPLSKEACSPFVSPSAKKINQTSDNDHDKEKFSFKLSNSTPETIPKSTVGPISKVSPGFSGEWECDACWVRNPLDKLKCIACETLRPVKEGSTSGKKDNETFKLSCPQNSSPITFKFLTHSNVPQVTTTTTSSSPFKGVEVTSSSFKFSVPSSGFSSTFFSAANSTAGSLKAPEITTSLPNNIGSPKFPPFNSDLTKQPFGEQSSNPCTENNISGSENHAKKISTTCEPIKNTAESNPCGINENSDVVVSNVGAANTNSTTAVVNDSGLYTSSDLKANEPVMPSTASSSSTANVTSKSNVCLPISTSSTNNFTFSQPLQDSKSVSGSFTFGSSGDRAGSAFNFKIPTSTVPSFGGFPISASNKETNKSSDVSEKISQPSLKDSADNVGVKTTSHFQMPSQTTSTPTSFPLPTSASAVFKFGDKIEPPKTTSGTTLGSSTFPSASVTNTTIPSFSFSSPSSSTFALISNPKTSETTAASGQFQQCVTKSQDVKVTTTVAPFSSSTVSNTFAFGNATAISSASGPSGFSFFSSTVSTTAVTNSNSAAIFTFGTSSSTPNQPKPGGFTFKSLGEEKQNSLPSNNVTFSTPSSTTSLFKFGTSVPTSGAFVFGTPKSEAQSVGSTPFLFGSGSSSTANPPTFSAFQTQTVNPTFQFGGQPSGSSVNTSFGTSNNSFPFANKTENANQVPCTASQPAVPAFGCPSMQPVFGSQTVPTFGRTERPSSGGFNFGVPAANPPVFRFGNEKTQTTSSGGFSFGAPQQAETSNAFQSNFNMSTPPTFNFGAASTPSGHFQFTASSDSAAGQQSSAPRKYRKAIRRVLRKQE